MTTHLAEQALGEERWAGVAAAGEAVAGSSARAAAAAAAIIVFMIGPTVRGLF
ncbi:hypothetical protein ACIRVN_33525 [Streptomyces albogriseolus]|uniref:hypothetical protein n=1 Tax=Streptomyces albogriseolus TaxID=1887 RepID=UPI0038101162